MKVMRWCPALAVALMAFAANAAEPRVGKFTQYDAGEFVIVTSRGASQARRVIEDLVKFRLTLERALGKRATRNETRTTILLVGNADWRKWLRPREGIAGYFQRGRFSNHMAIDGEESLALALHVVFHE
jgi:hypothetical protein